MHKPSAKRESVIEMLEHGGLTEDNVRKISQQTDVPEADIWGAGSFGGGATTDQYDGAY